MKTNRLLRTCLTRGSVVVAVLAIQLQTTASEFGSHPVRTIDLTGTAPSDGVTISPDQRLAAVGRRSGDLEIWDLTVGILKYRIAGSAPANPNAVPRVGASLRSAFSRDGTRVVAGLGGSLKILDSVTAEPVGELPAPPSTLATLALSAEGGILAGAGGMPLTLQTWDLTSAKPLNRSEYGPDLMTRRLTPGKARVQPASKMPVSGTFALSHDGALLAIAKSFQEIEVWTTRDGKYVRTVPCPYRLSNWSWEPDAVVFLGNSPRTAATYFHRDLWIQPEDASIPSQNILSQTPDRPGSLFEIHTLATSEDGQLLVAGGMSVGSFPGPFSSGPIHNRPLRAEARLWNGTTGAPLGRISGPAGGLYGVASLSRDGSTLMLVSGLESARFYSGACQQMVRDTATTGRHLEIQVWQRAK